MEFVAITHGAEKAVLSETPHSQTLQRPFASHLSQGKTGDLKPPSVSDLLALLRQTA